MTSQASTDSMAFSRVCSDPRDQAVADWAQPWLAGELGQSRSADEEAA